MSISTSKWYGFGASGPRSVRASPLHFAGSWRFGKLFIAEAGLIHRVIDRRDISKFLVRNGVLLTRAILEVSFYV